MESYSKEMRRDVLSACDRGEEARAVALRFHCSESWIRRIKQDRRETGKLAPCTTRNRVAEWQKHEEQIRASISQTPDMTLQELKDELGTHLSLTTLCRALQKLKLTLKKKF